MRLGRAHSLQIMTNSQEFLQAVCPHAALSKFFHRLMPARLRTVDMGLWTVSPSSPHPSPVCRVSEVSTTCATCSTTAQLTRWLWYCRQPRRNGPLTSSIPVMSLASRFGSCLNHFCSTVARHRGISDLRMTCPCLGGFLLT